LGHKDNNKVVSFLEFLLVTSPLERDINKGCVGRTKGRKRCQNFFSALHAIKALFLAHNLGFSTYRSSPTTLIIRIQGNTTSVLAVGKKLDTLRWFFGSKFGDVPLLRKLKNLWVYSGLRDLKLSPSFAIFLIFDVA